MTDPNVIEALKKTIEAVDALIGHDDSTYALRRAQGFVNEATDLLAAEKPAAPAIVPVKFNDAGFACGADREAGIGKVWTAVDHTTLDGSVQIDVFLRPGEDAGEAVAKMLAAVGRGP